MSGGSYGYAEHKLEEIAGSLYDNRSRDVAGLREFTATLLKLTAALVHDIEWIDSGDMGPSDEYVAVLKTLPALKDLVTAFHDSTYVELLRGFKRFAEMEAKAVEVDKTTGRPTKKS